MDKPPPAGRRFWRSLEELAGSRRRSRRCCTASSPTQARELDRPGDAAALPDADGRLARPGRPDRLRDAAAAARRSCPTSAARADRPRQAAVLRHRDAAGRHGDRPARREPRGPADQGRGQPRPPRQPRRHRRLRPGVDPGPVRPRPLADASPTCGRPRAAGTSAPSARLRRRSRPTRRGKTGGTGLRMLTETVASPTLADQLEPAAEGRFPRRGGSSTSRLGRRHRRRKARGWRSASRSTPTTTSRKADVILSLDADFLSCGGGQLALRPRLRGSPPQVRQARAAGDEPALRRRVRRHHVTGAVADHRLPSAAGAGRGVRPGPGGGTRLRERSPRRWTAGQVAADRPARRGCEGRRPIADLTAHRGRCVVLAGDGQPPAVHALAHAINQPAGQRRQDRLLHADHPPPSRRRSERAWRPLRELVGDMDARRGRDAAHPRRQPGLHAPRPTCDFADLERLSQGARLRRPPRSVPGRDGRAAATGTFPRRTYLETWGDARAFDGTVAHRPAADRAAVRRPVGARAAGRPRRGDRRGPATRSSARYWARTGRRATATFEQFWRQGAATTASSPARQSDAVKPSTLHDGWSAKHWPARARPRRRRTTSRSSSAPTRRSTTAASPTTAGCRNCPSR